MMKFRTMYDDFDRVPSNPGNAEEIEYSPVIGDDGVLSLEAVGKIDVRAEIDSYRESCDLNVIISRFNNGDVDVLSRTQGSYFDAVDLPHTFADMLNTINTAETEFLKLPLAVRERFDNSFHRWLSLMDNPVEFNRLMGSVSAEPAEPAEPDEPVFEEVKT